MVVVVMVGCGILDVDRVVVDAVVDTVIRDGMRDRYEDSCVRRGMRDGRFLVFTEDSMVGDGD